MDVDEFLKLEKQIYLDMFPQNKDIFDDQEEDDTEVDIAPKPKENKNVVKKGYGKKKRRLEEVESKDDSDDDTRDDEGYSD